MSSLPLRLHMGQVGVVVVKSHLLRPDTQHDQSEGFSLERPTPASPTSDRDVQLIIGLVFA